MYMLTVPARCYGYAMDAMDMLTDLPNAGVLLGASLGPLRVGRESGLGAMRLRRAGHAYAKTFPKLCHCMAWHRAVPAKRLRRIRPNRAGCMLRICDGSAMDLRWICDGSDLRRICDESAIDLRWICDGSAMDLRWVRRGTAIAHPWAGQTGDILWVCAPCAVDAPYLRNGWAMGACYGYPAGIP